ncbi:IS3 family transposase [Undibacterium sp. Ji50W]|uniref:IS3 family transposase n=1 Tax=Undibacterium sp. Ji50W TaxID=3413041 RepID=UPI003BF1A403
MKKIPKQAYTVEYKELAIKRVAEGDSIPATAKALGLSDQTLRNWVKAAASGKLNGVGSRVVTPEEMELSRLRAEVARLKRENEINKKSSGVLCEGCSVKYAWIDAQGKSFALSDMCKILEVSISGYRAWKRGGIPDRKRLTDEQMLALIRAIHAEIKGAYGSPRMVRELRLRGFTASKERVERLMRENNIRARHKRRYKVTTDSKHRLPVAENLLARNFRPSTPNQVWTSDITYLWTDEGWLYLAIVLDLFNREVIGWALRPRMTTDIVTDALTMAWFRRKPAAGVMHHSDRGSQYASYAFQEKLQQFGMTCSMSRKGNCWDNAPTESWFNSFKNERYHGLRYASHDEMKYAAFDYIEVFYNRQRQHSTLGYRSPIQYLEQWESEQSQQKLAA